LGVEKGRKRRKCIEKQEKAVKAGKFIAFSRKKKSVNLPLFRKFTAFSYFSTRFLAFLGPRKRLKKESVAPRNIANSKGFKFHLKQSKTGSIKDGWEAWDKNKLSRRIGRGTSHRK